MQYAQPTFAMPMTESSLDTDLQRARQLAMLLDAQFEVAGFKFGMDAVIGLIPGVGDAATSLAGLYIPYLARKHGLGPWITARMGANLLADFLVGSIPVLGDLFDAAFKANLKNLALLEKAIEQRQASRP